MNWFDLEESWLAPYAMRSRDTRGRRFAEEAHAYRSIFQRDRERIVHCTAFRRLIGKTQVLVGRINDHHRTRLTHTLEVAQIARTIARRLRLNEDLTEAIALSHDLGHPPFGHAGERALHLCMQEHGGFDHNLYGLRRVDELEDRYPEFMGLNLSFELREAFVQHSQRRDLPELQEFLAAGSPLLEAQIVDAADSLAYDTHDTDDALGIGLITLEDLDGIPLWRQAATPVREKYPHLKENAFRTAVIRELIAWQVSDLIAETESRLNQERIQSVQEVRQTKIPLVGFSSGLRQRKMELERFLYERVYRHSRVLGMARRGKLFLTRLFEAFVEEPELLPERQLGRWAGAPGRILKAQSAFVPERKIVHESLHRVVVDYLAGMTDRFAQQEYLRLFYPDQDL